MMGRAFWAVIARDMKLTWRMGGSAGLGLSFFLAVSIVVPFGIGPHSTSLARIGPAILWLAALLSTLLGLDRLFQTDHEDGSLDLIHGTGMPLELFVCAKVLAHWLATGLPLVMIAPLLGMLLALTPQNFGALIATLTIGTLALTFLGAIGAAITVSLKHGGILLALLILPLAVPLMIFGVGAISPNGLFGEALMILSGLALFSAVIGAFASAAALRLQWN